MSGGYQPHPTRNSGNVPGEAWGEPGPPSEAGHAMTEPRAQGSRSARHVVVTAPAELDVASAADLSSHLNAACEATDTITVDMTATTFCDMAGVRALRRARDLARAAGGELRLASSCPAVLRVLRLTGLDQAGPVYANVGQSLRTPRSDGGSLPWPRGAVPADQHGGLASRVPQQWSQ